MGDLLGWLSGGDLRSDGESDQVARFILAHPEAFPDLIEALANEDKVIRGHAADALEKVARDRPDLLSTELDRLVPIGREDPAAAVRMHLAMIYGHLACLEGLTERLGGELERLLDHEGSAFVLSWAITSMAILAGIDRRWYSRALSSIAHLRQSESVAVRTRAEMALAALTDERRDFPRGWIKSGQVRAALARSANAG